MKIVFEIDSKYGQYKDCLNLSDDHTLTDEEIEQIKQTRFQKWYGIIDKSFIAEQ